MKKIIAFVLTISLIFAIAVPTFAETLSPENPKNYTVTYYGVKGVSDGATSTVKAGDTITVDADTAKGTFENWVITGNYTITGSLTDSKITITPTGDITVTGKYKVAPVLPTQEERDYNRNGKYDVQVVSGIGVNEDGTNNATWTNNKASVTFDSVTNRLTAIALENNGDFDNWTVYKVVSDETGKKNYTPAVEGRDYSLVVDFNGVEEGQVLTEEYKTAKAEYQKAIENAVKISDEEIAAASTKYYTELAKVYGMTRTDLIAKLLREKKITIIPLADIVLCGNYNGKTTSPKTTDYSVYFAFIAVLSLACASLTAKKILSK